jgi:hypothetical protein
MGPSDPAGAAVPAPRAGVWRTTGTGAAPPAYVRGTCDRGAMVWGQLYAPSYGPLAEVFHALGLGQPVFLSSPSTALVSLAVFNILADARLLHGARLGGPHAGPR